MKIVLLTAIFASLSALIFLTYAPIGKAADIVLTPEAITLTRQSLLIDGHNDLPWALRLKNDREVQRYDLNQIQNDFHTDIPRLKEGGVGAQFWSVYVPSNTMDDNTSLQMTLEQIDTVYRMVRKYPDTFEMAFSSEDIVRIRAKGKIASLIGMEGGHSIENSLENLRHLYNQGARYMTLTHSRSLSWADSATDTARNGGLTDFGRQVVQEMNRIGMFIDISHVSEATMKDVLEISKAPVIASHSSANAIRNHVRNIPDTVLKLLPKNGGVIMVNFYSDFVTDNGNGDIDTVVDHIDYIARVAGIDHVGLGSDFDGVPRLPKQLENVSKYPYITQALLNRGYSHDDIKKILGGNLLRAFAQMEQIAHG